MTKTEFIKQYEIDLAPEEIKEELMEVLADMPDELSEDDLNAIMVYVIHAQDREQQAAMDLSNIAGTLNKYADTVDKSLADEDTQVAKIARDNLAAVQNLVQ